MVGRPYRNPGRGRLKGVSRLILKEVTLHPFPVTRKAGADGAFTGEARGFAETGRPPRARSRKFVRDGRRAAATAFQEDVDDG